jgi:hypothetical protein
MGFVHLSQYKVISSLNSINGLVHISHSISYEIGSKPFKKKVELSLGLVN